MKTLVISDASHTVSKLDSGTYARVRRRWTGFLLLSSICAAITGLFGLVLAGASLLQLISRTGKLSISGAVLLVITFPILIFAAHCLERIEDANHSIRIASYRRKMLETQDFDAPDANWLK